MYVSETERDIIQTEMPMGTPNGKKDTGDEAETWYFRIVRTRRLQFPNGPREVIHRGESPNMVEP